MSGFETTAAPHDILDFDDSIAGRIREELHYVPTGRTLGQVIDVELSHFVGTTAVVKSARTHASVLAYARIKIDSDLSPYERKAVDDRADVFARGAVLAAHVVPPRGNDELRDLCLRTPVSVPFTGREHNTRITRQDVMTYEAEMRHLLTQIDEEERQQIIRAAQLGTLEASVSTLAESQDEFVFGFLAVRRAVLFRLQSLQKRSE